MKHLHSSFWLGFAACFFFVNMRQDLYGLERCVEVCRATWVDSHWSVWAFFMVLATVTHVAIVRRQQQTERDQ